jgi:hypothetical protein
MPIGESPKKVRVRSQDLWNIGRAIGISGFKEDEETNRELQQMTRDLARAKREDKKMMSDDEERARSALHRVIQGKQDEGAISDAQIAVDHNFKKMNAQWMKVIRAKYQGVVIRRTVNSLDYAGRPISGLEPYDEHICLLKLHRHEYDALERLAEKTLNDESFAQRFSSEVSDGLTCVEGFDANRAKSFYLDIRRCLLHPCFVNATDDAVIKDYAQYNLIPSCKLESLVEILTHHLAADGAPGLLPSRHRPAEYFTRTHASSGKSSQEAQPSSSNVSPPSSSSSNVALPSSSKAVLLPSPQGRQLSQHTPSAGAPDKIIIYSFFASSFDLIRLVSCANQKCGRRNADM